MHHHLSARIRRSGRSALTARAVALAAVVALAVAASGLGSTATATPPTGHRGPVTGWLHRHADPLRTVAPEAPLGDLTHLRRSVGHAQIVGLGEAAHGIAEQTTLKHRTVRFLVERMGFRSIAWEDDWTLGVQINDYLRTGAGDLPALVGQMSPAWRSQEVVEVLRWLRDFNAGREDQVQFVGVEFFTTRALAYDEVAAYVARVAPDRLAQVEADLAPIRPTSADMRAHLTWYLDVADQEPYIRHARDVYAAVSSLPHRPGDPAHAVATHHARQIVNYYEHFALPYLDSFASRDTRAAENLRWWQEFTGDRVAYWAASAHTADMPDLRATAPPGPDLAWASVGSYLRDWYGDRYLSIGFTFDHGTVAGGAGEPVTVPPPAPDWFEREFDRVRAAQFTLDLRSPAPPHVRAWLAAPARTRGLPELGHASHISGGSVGQWFDVIVHRRSVTPVTPL